MSPRAERWLVKVFEVMPDLYPAAAIVTLFILCVMTRN